MIKTFEQLIETVKKGDPQILSVAVAQDKDVLEAVAKAYTNQIINGAYLVGNAEEIKRIAEDNGIAIDDFSIVDEKDKNEACLTAMKIVRDGKASLPMKGFVDTSIALKALLNKEVGLRTDHLICHVGLLEVSGFDRMFIISDSAMNIEPDVNQKTDIIKACTEVAHSMGNQEPKVAVLCAVEKVNQKMQSTIDAEELKRRNEAGKITGCIVDGPLALDNAVSAEAAEHKGICGTVAGHADILICPDIEAGNILNKSMEYFARSKKAGCIMGAAKPMVLTSRASSDISKMNSIALSVLIAQNAGKKA